MAEKVTFNDPSENTLSGDTCRETVVDLEDVFDLDSGVDHTSLDAQEQIQEAPKSLVLEPGLYVYSSSCLSDPYVKLEKGVRVVIGREHTCNMRIKNKFISRQHTCIYLNERGQPMVEDLNSRNGTYVNGNKIHRKRILRTDDWLRVGNADIRLEQVEKSLIMDEDDDGIEGTGVFQTRALTSSHVVALQPLRKDVARNLGKLRRVLEANADVNPLHLFMKFVLREIPGVAEVAIVEFEMAMQSYKTLKHLVRDGVEQRINALLNPMIMSVAIQGQDCAGAQVVPLNIWDKKGTKDGFMLQNDSSQELVPILCQKYDHKRLIYVAFESGKDPNKHISAWLHIATLLVFKYRQLQKKSVALTPTLADVLVDKSKAWSMRMQDTGGLAKGAHLRVCQNSHGHRMLVAWQIQEDIALAQDLAMASYLSIEHIAERMGEPGSSSVVGEEQHVLETLRNYLQQQATACGVKFKSLSLGCFYYHSQIADVLGRGRCKWDIDLSTQQENSDVFRVRVDAGMLKGGMEGLNWACRPPKEGE